jgi:hypothetical protein
MAWIYLRRRSYSDRRRGKMQNREAAIAAIRTCKTRDALDDLLRRFDLSGSQEIIDCLNECM